MRGIQGSKGEWTPSHSTSGEQSTVRSLKTWFRFENRAVISTLMYGTESWVGQKRNESRIYATESLKTSQTTRDVAKLGLRSQPRALLLAPITRLAQPPVCYLHRHRRSGSLDEAAEDSSDNGGSTPKKKTAIEEQWERAGGFELTSVEQETYEKYFYGTEHWNYFTNDEDLGPVILSIKQETLNARDQFSMRISLLLIHQLAFARDCARMNIHSSSYIVTDYDFNEDHITMPFPILIPDLLPMLPLDFYDNPA
ncbi:Signal-induced proliferation-associated 1-like protein 1 [Eumeta japonica]|uniref:Signal-induced proliferation-associated 1-like protein 1 n=1 Tax=Eumeta variegata TaxID=151549 RepID=A0A4C1WCB5_EUMVA|nr:Signal-induced proliferation-associated 1-like protein 1 [Eumeta japonica]